MSATLLQPTFPRARGFRRQTAVGLTLASAILACWIAVHAAGVFLLPWHTALLFAPVLILAQCWLSVGLFILAHDAMHGSLAPFRPRTNRAVGRLVLMVYAGIWYDGLLSRHFAHHRAPGTEHDPDFSGDGRVDFLRWYGAFFAEYLTAGQAARVLGAASLYVYGLGVDPVRLLLLWAVPALLSSVQLFYFGTYLPHRAEDRGAFADRHRTRSNDFPYLLSLLTCFHFGYHHEHHANPSVPWWRLPASRRAAPARPGPQR